MVWAEAYLHPKWHILTHPAVWSEQIDMGRKLWGALFEGELGTHLTQYMAWAEAYLHAKFHHDPYNHLASIKYTKVTDGATVK